MFSEQFLTSFLRDYAAKIYSWIPFGFTVVLVEIPYIIFITTLTFVSLYWASGLNKQNDSDSAGYLYFAMVIFTMYCVAFGQSVASVCSHIIQAIIILPIVVLFLFLFPGVLNPPSSMPYFWYVSNLLQPASLKTTFFVFFDSSKTYRKLFPSA